MVKINELLLDEGDVARDAQGVLLLGGEKATRFTVADALKRKPDKPDHVAALTEALLKKAGLPVPAKGELRESEARTHVTKTSLTDAFASRCR